MGLELFMAVMDQASRHGLPVDGHLPFAVPAVQAASAGMRTVEHLSGFTMGCSSEAREVGDEFTRMMAGPPLLFPEGEIAYFSLIRRASDSNDDALCQATAEAYRDGGVTVSPTLMNAWSQINAPEVVSDSVAMGLVPRTVGERWSFMAGPGPGETFAEIMRPAYEALRRRLELLHETGVPIVAGTDIGNPFVVPGRSLHDELSALSGVGHTPLEVLQAATWNPVRVLALSDTVGRVAVGYAADLVLLAEDPLADVENVRSITGVVRAGGYYGEEQLADMVARALASAEAGG